MWLTLNLLKQLTLILSVMSKASAKLHKLKNWELLSYDDDV